MSSLWGRVLINYPYFMAAILFVIGVVTVLTRSNLFKKLTGNQHHGKCHLSYLCCRQ